MRYAVTIQIPSTVIVEVDADSPEVAKSKALVALRAQDDIDIETSFGDAEPVDAWETETVV